MMMTIIHNCIEDMEKFPFALNNLLINSEKHWVHFLVHISYFFISVEGVVRICWRGCSRTYCVWWRVNIVLFLGLLSFFFSQRLRVIQHAIFMYCSTVCLSCVHIIYSLQKGTKINNSQEIQLNPSPEIPPLTLNPISFYLV